MQWLSIAPMIAPMTAHVHVFYAQLPLAPPQLSNHSYTYAHSCSFLGPNDPLSYSTTYCKPINNCVP